MPPVTRLLTDALHVAMISASPIFAAALATALGSAVFVAWTKLDDPALRILPRAAAAWLALFLSAGFASAELVAFATQAYGQLFELTR